MAGIWPGYRRDIATIAPGGNRRLKSRISRDGRLMVWTPPAINGFAMGQGCVSNIRRARSDCHESQLLRKVSEVAHRVHRLWERAKRPAWGLVGNPRVPVVHAGHGDLHGVMVLMMGFSISSKRRMVATIATLCSLPLAIRCS